MKADFTYLKLENIKTQKQFQTVLMSVYLMGFYRGGKKQTKMKKSEGITLPFPLSLLDDIGTITGLGKPTAHLDKLFTTVIDEVGGLFTPDINEDEKSDMSKFSAPIVGQDDKDQE